MALKLVECVAGPTREDQMGEGQVTYLRMLGNSRITSLWESVSAALAKGDPEKVESVDQADGRA
jgi:hypothetical protein